VTQVAAGLLVVALTTLPAGASEFEFSMENGRVTIRAQDALLTDILAEWSRVGDTAIFNADELGSETVTIALVEVPEAKALRSLLRTANGYLAAPRAGMTDGVSRFDRILILTNSSPAAGVASVSATVSDSNPQRLGILPNASGGQTSFTVSPAQQEQLDQLQQLLQQPEDEDTEPHRPVTTRPTFGSVAARRGMSVTTVDPLKKVGDVPAGNFGSVTPAPEAPDDNATPVANIPRR
jgi:hypothetical protein